MIPHRYISISLWASLLTLAIYSLLTATAWPVNVWSPTFARPALAQGLVMVNPPPPPEGHRRGAVWLASAALERGDVTEAERLLQEQNTPFALRVLGEIQSTHGNNVAAIRLWTDARDRVSLLNRAKELVSEGNLKDAKQAYLAILIELHSETAFLPYAELLAQQMEDSQQAITLLQNALDQFPESSRAGLWLRALGDLFSAQGKWIAAENAYHQAIERDPQLYWAYIGLGNTAYAQHEDRSTAIAWYQNAIGINPENGFAYFQIAEILASENQYTEAENWYRAATNRKPDARWWWLSRANNMRAAGKHDQADALYQKALEISAGWAPIYYEMAWNYKLWNHPQDARIAIEQAIRQMDSENPWYYIRAGRIHEWLRNREKALVFYQKALIADPDNQAARTSIEQIQQSLVP